MARMVLLVLVVLVFIGGGAVVLWFSSAMERARVANERARASLDPQQVCDQVFAGAPAVTYEVSPRTLPYEVVVAGAIARGYRLEGESDGVLVFAKAAR